MAHLFVGKNVAQIICVIFAPGWHGRRRTLQQTGWPREVLDGMLSSWMLCLEQCHTGRDKGPDGQWLGHDGWCHRYLNGIK